MYLRVSFPVDGSIKPKISIETSVGECSVRPLRWQQFLLLLAYHKKTNIEGGWVTLEEVSQLSAFRRLSPKKTGQYLMDSYRALSRPMKYFIRKCIELTSKNPYLLYLESNRIQADTSQLSKYLNLISLAPKENYTEQRQLWETAESLFNNFEMASSLKLFKLFIDKNTDGRKNNKEKLIIAFTRLLEIERYCKNNQINSALTIKSALEYSNCIRSVSKRNILSAKLFAQNANLLKVNDSNLPKILAFNDLALELLEKDKNPNADNYCALGSRYYHNSYLAARFDGIDTSEDYYKLAIKFYTRMNKIGIPIISKRNDGILEMIKIQRQLLITLKRKQKISNDEVAWLHELSENNTIDKYYSLLLSSWIMTGMIRKNEFGRAVEFIEECLLKHPQLHEFAIYRNMYKKRACN